ncbi:hypothetical protein GCM10011316_31570 [Roseibium aquae]|uniref:Uncharacterized protein n=1 Tax=Roseibium aquae TaxID=1323746 RepID=A0A916TMP7_9HYPH|nr:hypothetical protein [Roseibium aquae]GGB57168.1 hypothetical protein GCM10011316_31570 [Roseibium aquae]
MGSLTKPLIFLVMLTSVHFFPGGSASAETLTFQIRSEHPNIVDVELYSDTRQGHVWPGRERVYVLNNYTLQRIGISCQKGERVCYGAWVRNRTETYWGVGYQNRMRCRSCCYICDGGQTEVIVLKP